MSRVLRPTLCFIALAFLGATSARSQDAFEIQVYEYELVPKGAWSLETHLNYTAIGSKSYDGPVAPTNGQIHLTYELTRGISKYFEMAGYLLLARRPGMDAPMEYAGFRLRPRFALPEHWLPVKVSISTEFGFPKHIYEENRITFELRPIVEKEWGHYQLDVNPTITHVVNGPGTVEGWEFEPAVRFAYTGHRLEPSFEYYGATGPLRKPLPRADQTHQFYPGGDWHLSKHLVLNFGLGAGATSAGNRLVAKLRLGYEFGTHGE